MEKKNEEFARRASLLAEAVGQLPADAMTVSALIDVAISAAIAVMVDPSAARSLFEAKVEEYERHWGGIRSESGIRH